MKETVESHGWSFPIPRNLEVQMFYPLASDPAVCKRFAKVMYPIYTPVI